MDFIEDKMVFIEHIWWEYDEFGNMLEEFHDLGTPTEDNYGNPYYEPPMDGVAESRYVYNYDCWE
jgi:hypothetical protein